MALHTAGPQDWQHVLLEVDPIARGCVDGRIGTEIECELSLLLTRRHGDDAPRSPELGELDHQGSHTTRGRVHHDRFTRHHARRRAQEVPCGEALHEQTEGCRIAHAIGHLEGRRGRNECAFGVPARA